MSRLTILSGIGAFLAGCGGNTAGEFVRSSGLGPKTAEPQTFVVQSRKGTVDYIPVGTVAAGPANPAKNAEQVKEAEQEMDSLRARNANAGAAAAAAGGTPPPDPALTPASANAKKKVQTTPSTNP
ncbi:hypothetical protein [Microvirga flavescens]|uniref:hypothetical protein n=1 Tax=Microvirga flavescens TaxID=2249811 RepID=UPI0013009F62|nr:hypothetical protein [Microvirga flavescens]